MKIKRLLFILLAFILFTNYVDASGEQQALWFMDDLNFSQAPGGDYSHLGTLNFDVTGVNSDNIYAPFDCVVVAMYTAWDSGNTVVIESKNPVRYANSTVDYMTMTFAHDNNVSDLYVGKEIRQGEVFYQTGTYGNVTGKHSHVSCIKGKFQGDIWTVNSYGNSWSPNSITPTDALYIKDSTRIYDTKGLSFKKSNVDEEAPVVQSAYIDIASMTSNSYKVLVKATDNVGVTQVKVPTWTLKEDASGEPQDDLVWHVATYNSSTGYWEYTVKASEHNNEIGIYRTHAYAYDAAGNRSKSYTMQYIPMSSTLNHSLGDEFYARISAYGLDKNNSLGVGLESTTGSSIQLKSKFINFSDEYQIFKFVKNSDSTYSIINVKTGLYLDPKGAENNGGQQFQITSPSGKTNQKYYLMNYNGGIRFVVASSANEFMGMDLQGAQLVEDASFIPYQPRTLDKANHTFSLLKVATDITLSDTDIDLKVNETKQLNVSYTPSDTYLKEVTWTSSNTSVATVNRSGLVTAKGKGTAVITATTKDGSNISKSVNISVTQVGGIVVADGKAYYYDSNNKIKKGLFKGENSNNYYYANNDGILQKGLVTINGKTYYFDENYCMVKGQFVKDNGNLYFFSANDGTMKKTGWFTRKNAKYYSNKSTGVISTGLQTIDNKKYYFDANGVMQVGIQEINHVKYYFNTDGRMVSGQFVKDDDNLYFFSANDGSMKKTGWFTRSGKKYYADKTSGIIAVGLQTIDNKKYYFDANGVMQVGIQEINHVKYYFNTDGRMVSGQFIKDNGNLYFFSANDGSMKKTGWFTRSGKKYYADKTSGIIAVGLQTIDNKKYYFDANGVMQIGWQKISNYQYYFNTDGVMQTGIQEIDNLYYYFNSEGRMAKGQFVKDNGNLYFFSANDGTMKKSGWFTRSDKKYYADKKSGVIAVGLQTIDNKKYYFDDNGVMQTGIQEFDHVKYYFNTDGKMVSGQFVKDNGKLYFFSANDGSMKKTGWFTKANKKYYADKTTGEIYTGTKTIDGKTYKFSSEGVFIEEVKNGNPYTKNTNYLYVQNTDQLSPSNKQELYNAVYTVMNYGEKSHTFQCMEGYTTCIEDFKEMINSGDLWNLSYYINPFNMPGGVSYSYGSNKFTVSFTTKYTEEMQQELNDKMTEIEKDLYTAGDTNIDKMKKIHDYIVNHTKYDEARYNTGESEYDSYTAYGSIIQGNAVCQGYTEAMSLFLDRIGIDNYRIVSSTHTWNAVFINNQWLHLDATWDDPITSNGTDILRYDYYLVNTDTLHNNDKGIDHQFDATVFKEFAI